MNGREGLMCRLAIVRGYVLLRLPGTAREGVRFLCRWARGGWAPTTFAHRDLCARLQLVDSVRNHRLTGFQTIVDDRAIVR